MRLWVLDESYRALIVLQQQRRGSLLLETQPLGLLCCSERCWIPRCVIVRKRCVFQRENPGSVPYTPLITRFFLADTIKRESERSRDMSLGGPYWSGMARRRGTCIHAFIHSFPGAKSWSIRLATGSWRAPYPRSSPTQSGL